GKDVSSRPGRNRHLGETKDARREVLADIALHTAGPRRRADHAEGPADLLAHDPGAVETGLDRRRVPEEIDRVLDIAIGYVQALEALLTAGFIQIEADAARPHEAPAKTAAAQDGRQVQEIAAEPSAVGRRRQEANVIGKGAQIARVIGQAL